MKNFNLLKNVRIALYARKSVFRDTIISVELQIESMKKHFLNLYGSRCEFFTFEDEGHTGKNNLRPAFQRLLEDAKQDSFDIIAVHKIDGCSRNTYDFNVLSKELEKLDIILVSTSEGCDSSTDQGQMFMKIISIIAEWDGSQIAKRVSDSMESLAKLGCFSGGYAPTGYTITRLPYKLPTNKKKLCYLEINPDKKNYT